MKEMLEKFLSVNCDVQKLPEVFGSGEWTGKCFVTPQVIIAWNKAHIFHAHTPRGKYIIDKIKKKVHKYDARYIRNMLMHHFNSNSKLPADMIIREFALKYKSYGNDAFEADGYTIVIYPERGEVYINDKRMLVRNPHDEWEKV